MITWDSVKKNLKSISPDEMRAIEEKAKSSILSSAKKQKPIVLDTDEKIEKYLKSQKAKIKRLIINVFL